MAKDLRAPKHPAAKYFKLAFLLAALALVFTVISLFAPWSRIVQKRPILVFNGIATQILPRDAGVRTYIGLWQSCIDYNNLQDLETCINNDNDNAAGPVGVNGKCKDYFVGVQVLTVMSFILLLILVLILHKINKTMWKRPLTLGRISIVLAFLVMIFLFMSWIFWIVYAEEDCAGSTFGLLHMSWPVQGYSYGFILQIFSWLFMLIAFVVLLLGCKTLAKGVADAAAPKMPMYGAPIPTPPTPYSAPASAAPTFQQPNYPSTYYKPNYAPTHYQPNY